MTPQVRTLETRFVDILNETAKIEFFVKVLGTEIKCFVAVNDETWTSINYSNFKRDKEYEINFIIKTLQNGSYDMFRKNKYEA